MKKSVVILIGIIYLVAVVTVSFIGLKAKEFDATAYIENIEFTNSDIVVIDGGYRRIKIDFETTQTYQLEWTITPDVDKVTNPKVTFAWEGTAATVDENGLVTFTKKGSIIVYVSTTDGSMKSDSVIVRAQ